MKARPKTSRHDEPGEDVTNLVRLPYAKFRKALTLSFFALMIFALLVIMARAHFSQAPYETIGMLAHKPFRLQIVLEAKDQELGLSGRDSMSQDQGMLFAYEAAHYPCFWMKDMKFSLDILWFDQNMRLVHSELNLRPETYPKTFCSDRAAQYVLEVTAGTAEALQLRDGDLLQIKL